MLELLKPMLRQWLERNMPRLVAEALKEEAAEPARRRRVGPRRLDSRGVPGSRTAPALACENQTDPEIVLPCSKRPIVPPRSRRGFTSDGWRRMPSRPAGRSAPRLRAYCIVIPPPNVTGSLHMGHALNNTLQDVLCRFERMRGKDVLWQPGTDHAGIATQLVVERQMMERQEPDRHEHRPRQVRREGLGVEGRERRHHHQPAQAPRRLLRLVAESASPWTRACRKAVLKVFVDLYNEGLIYKDKRLVNWDPEFQSALSDLEVEIDARRQGARATSCRHRGSPRYPLTADDRLSGGATTSSSPRRAPRPCWATPRSPCIPRTSATSDLVGKKVVLPLVGREIPDHRRRILRSREGLGRGEDHAGARLQRLRGLQAPPEIGR